MDSDLRKKFDDHHSTVVGACRRMDTREACSILKGNMCLQNGHPRSLMPAIDGLMIAGQQSNNKMSEAMMSFLSDNCKEYGLEREKLGLLFNASQAARVGDDASAKSFLKKAGIKPSWSKM